MIKSELINQLASKQPHLSHADVTAVVNNILEQMAQELATGGRIEIRGFGAFCCAIKHLKWVVIQKLAKLSQLNKSMLSISSPALN